MKMNTTNYIKIFATVYALSIGLSSKAFTITTQPSNFSAISGQNASFSVIVNGASNATYIWQVDTNNANDFIPIANGGKYTNANTATLTITGVSCHENYYRYRCVVSDAVPGGTSVATSSSAAILTINGCINYYKHPVYPNNPTAFSIIDPATDLKFMWQVKENKRSGFRAIDTSGNDGKYYRITGDGGSRLTVKNAEPFMNNNKYKVIVWDTVNNSFYESDAAPLHMSGPVDPLRFELTGALYSQPNGLADDNDQALTQTYIRCSIPLGAKARSGINMNSGNRLMYFRNLFIQLTYSTNVGKLNYVNDSSKKALNVTSPDHKYVNQLDLYQYANLNLNIMSPIFTWMSGCAHKEDWCNIYLDPYVSLLHTTVADSPSSSISVVSVLYGANLTFRLKPINRFAIELNNRVFGMDVISGGINPRYNFQYARRADYDVTGNGKPLTIGSRPYFNFDGLLIYNTSSNSDNMSNVFLHLSVISNLVKPQYAEAKNTFYQLQIGVAADVEKLGQNLLKTFTKS